MKGIAPLSVLFSLVVLGCGPPPPVEEPVEPLPEPELPPPPPPPEVRCKVDGRVSGSAEADGVLLLSGATDAKLVLVGPSSVRFAEVDEEGGLTESRAPLVKVRRATLSAAPAGSEHLVVVEAASPRRGKSRLAVSRFGTGGARVGQALAVDRTGVSDAGVEMACTAEACLLVWTEEGEDEGSVHVARALALTDEGPALAGEESTKLPGAPSLLRRLGDGFEVVIADRRHAISAEGEVSEGEELTTPRGGYLKIAESPTGAASSMFVESTMPYGLTVAVIRPDGGEPRQTRLWDGASEESRFGLASGQLGFGTAWARPEGEAGPYAEAEGAAALARVFFRGFSSAGVPHGDQVELTTEPVRVGSLDVVGLSNGYVVAWTTPGRRREGLVSRVLVSCRELTADELEAERAAAATSEEARGGGGPGDAGPAPEGDAGAAEPGPESPPSPE